jgi:hypothetical protein
MSGWGLLLISLLALASDPVDKLLQGVEEVASPGVPGSICAFGDRAFVLLTGANGVPIIGGTEAGKGRALALGHGGYLGAESMEQGQTLRLLRNALQWLAGGKRRCAIACLGHGPLAKLLRDEGFKVVEEATFEAVDVAILGEGQCAPQLLNQLQEFLTDGGGILVAATGWGWQQLNPGKQLARDLRLQRLLVPWGLAFGLETAGDSGQDCMVTSERPAALSHAGHSLAVLRRGGLQGAELAKALARLKAALDCLPDHEPKLLVPLRELLEDPGAGSPLAELVTHASKRSWRPLSERLGPWYLLGPFSSARLSAPSGVERELKSMVRDAQGPDLAASHRGKAGKTRWQRLDVDGDGLDLDVGEVRLAPAFSLPKGQEQWARGSTAFLYRKVELTEASEWALNLTTDAAVRFWSDGELVVDHEPEATSVTPTLPLHLRFGPGVHHWLVKVRHEQGSWGLRMGRSSSVDSRQVQAAIDRGVAYLLDEQQVDGSWSAFGKYDVGYTAYSLYTLLKSGVPRNDSAVQRALGCVRTLPAHHTYSMACKILALSAWGTPDVQAELQEAVQQLIEWQEPDGLFAYPVYPDGQRLPQDLSNTLYASLALRAAAHRQARIPASVWEHLLEGVAECFGVGRSSRERLSGEAGGFGYRKGEAATGSMTTAGFSVLLIARQALQDRLDAKLRREVDAAQRSALAWLDENMTVRENSGKNRWHFFALYGLERVGALLNEDILGRKNWYWTGAEYLVGKQNEEGSWQGDDSDHNKAQDTLLGLLFLRRATAVTGTQSARPPQVHTVQGDLRLRVLGDNPYTVWVLGTAPESSVPVERVVRVRYQVRSPAGEVWTAAESSRPDGQKEFRFETRLTLPVAGKHVLWAEAEVVGEARTTAGDAEQTRLSSEEQVLEVSSGHDAEVLLYPVHRNFNLLRSAVRVEASSANSTHPASHAADGKYGSRWVSRADDRSPWWRATFSTPVTADQLFFSHARCRRRDGGEPQVAQVEITINEGPPQLLELDASPLRKSRLQWEAPQGIRQIEVRVLKSLSRASNQGVGFSEIELLKAADLNSHPQH